MNIRISLFIFFIAPSLAYAQEITFDEVRDTVFWPKLYKSDYKTLYCGVEKAKGNFVSVERIYPANWIAQALGCKDSSSCKLEKFKEASSDLHNMWPALEKFVSSRRNLKFGEIEGEAPRFEEPICDFERTTGKNAIVEPRDEVKGKIARSLLYMVHWYDLPTHDLLPLMIKWNSEYPATDEEIKRHDLIEKIQSKTNPFIRDSNDDS